MTWHDIIQLRVAGAPRRLAVRVDAMAPRQLDREEKVKGPPARVAFDGDADRLLAVDEKGRLVDGDFIMAICALHMKIVR